MTANREHVSVVIIGGGPSGLRAAAELSPRVAGHVVVLERESQAGGIPRHCEHTGQDSDQHHGDGLGRHTLAGIDITERPIDP
jgi:cation diffusion facilitator CzcD-associated flavoprotein CzcO